MFVGELKFLCTSSARLSAPPGHGDRKHGDQGVSTVEDFLSGIGKLIAAKTPFE